MSWRLNHPNVHSFLFPPDTLGNLRRIAERNGESVEELLLGGVAQVLQERRAVMDEWTQKTALSDTATGGEYTYPGYEKGLNATSKPEPKWVREEMTLPEYDERRERDAEASLKQKIVTLDVPEEIMTSVRGVNDSIWNMVFEAANRVVLNEFELDEITGSGNE